MYIVDRNRDFYDYVSNIYGVDKGIVFDRRESQRITDHDLKNTMDFPNPNLVSANRFFRHFDENRYIILETGAVQYLIKIFDVKFTKDKVGNFNLKSYSCKVVREFYENKNRFGFPISLKRARLHYQWAKNTEQAIQSDTFEELFLPGREEDLIKLPILAGTSLTSILDPDKIWKDIMNYISSLKNDVDVSIPMTDVEKAEVHGFDKKSSFRHPIK